MNLSLTGKQTGDIICNVYLFFSIFSHIYGSAAEAAYGGILCGAGMIAAVLLKHRDIFPHLQQLFLAGIRNKPEAIQQPFSAAGHTGLSMGS